MPRTSPVSAWKSLREGNERFVGGALQHPGQGAADRAKLVAGQQPSVILFGRAQLRGVAGDIGEMTPIIDSF